MKPLPTEKGNKIAFRAVSLAVLYGGALLWLGVLPLKSRPTHLKDVFRGGFLLKTVQLGHVFTISPVL